MSRASLLNQSEIESAAWSNAREELDNNSFYLLQRTGPTVFKLLESDEVYRVVIGSPHTCSCKAKTICMHILFVILKVLRVPETNALCKKINLTDAEIDIVLSGNFGERVRAPRVKKERKVKPKPGITETPGDDFVERQPMDDASPDVCPICQDDMTKDDALTWCRKGCGNNIHAKCMKLYVQYKKSSSTEIPCPLCREDWGPGALQVLAEDCRGKSSLRQSCATVICTSCTFQIRGEFFRCLECSISRGRQRKERVAGSDDTSPLPPLTPVDFCQRCFNNLSREHSKHHFVSSSSSAMYSEFIWTTAKNPRSPQTLLDIQQLRALQNRDLGDDDYDFLLSLDRPTVPPLQRTLLDALPLVSTEDITPNDYEGQCWCSSREGSGEMRKLPCRHNVHGACLSVLLDEALDEGCFKLDDIKCRRISCGQRVFGALSRRRRRRKPLEEVNTNDKGQSSSPNPQQGIAVLGVCGLGVGGRGSVPVEPQPNVSRSSASVSRRAARTSRQSTHRLLPSARRGLVLSGSGRVQQGTQGGELDIRRTNSFCGDDGRSISRGHSPARSQSASRVTTQSQQQIAFGSSSYGSSSVSRSPSAPEEGSMQGLCVQHRGLGGFSESEEKYSRGISVGLVDRFSEGASNGGRGRPPLRPVPRRVRGASGRLSSGGTVPAGDLGACLNIRHSEV